CWGGGAGVQGARVWGDRAACADVGQEPFHEAARHFAAWGGRNEAELCGWLRQILAGRVAHLVRRYLGTQARDVRLERELVNEIDQSSRAIDFNLVAPHSTPSQRASRREQAVLLADAL